MNGAAEDGCCGPIATDDSSWGEEGSTRARAASIVALELLASGGRKGEENLAMINEVYPVHPFTPPMRDSDQCLSQHRFGEHAGFILDTGFGRTAFCIHAESRYAFGPKTYG